MRSTVNANLGGLPLEWLNMPFMPILAGVVKVCRTIYNGKIGLLWWHVESKSSQVFST